MEVDDEAGNALGDLSGGGDIPLFILQQIRISVPVTCNRHGLFSCRSMKPEMTSDTSEYFIGRL